METSVQRNQLEKTLASVRALEPQLTPPPRGWLYAIRNALEMPLEALAEKLRIRVQSVHELETRESAGTITLNTLRDAAEAIGCTLVYAILPDRPLDFLLDSNAEMAASKMLRSLENTMALEGQQTSLSAREELREILIEQLKREPKKIWKLLGEI